MELTRCRTCLYPTTKVDLHFDESGQCSACKSYENRPNIDWKARETELLQLLDKHNGKCIVPSSGGKDSTYIAIRLKELGADVTAVTATTCHLSEIGRKNIDNLTRHVRTIEVTPNMTVRAKLNRLSLEMVGDPSWPEHVSIHRVPFKVACETRTPLIFYGECPNNQYGGPLGTENTKKMTQLWASEFAGFLGIRAQDFVGIDGITERDMLDYMAPTDQELKEAKVTAYFLGWFEEWDSHRNAIVAREHGMIYELPGQMNWWEHENEDNLQVAIHDHAMYRKYGYGRLTAQISVDIRDGLISRSEALKIVEERDGLFPHKYLGEDIVSICNHMGITVARLLEILDTFTNWELFCAVYKNSPVLRKNVSSNQNHTHSVA